MMDDLKRRWARLEPHLTVVGPDDDRPRPAVLMFHGCGGLRDHLQRPAVIVVVMLLGGVIETLYWLRQGGDFMSGRVLLAPLFLLLLPVMVIPLRIPSRRPEDSTLAEMDALWDAAKAAERAG